MTSMQTNKNQKSNRSNIHIKTRTHHNELINLIQQEQRSQNQKKMSYAT